MRIRLLVYANIVSKGSDKPLYERIVDWDSSLQFPVESTLKTMKCLYGNQCVVVLEFM